MQVLNLLNEGAHYGHTPNICCFHLLSDVQYYSLSYPTVILAVIL